ncbi:ParB/RepB/Spo0J family partition protein [Streptomyces sp. NPDC001774]
MSSRAAKLGIGASFQQAQPVSSRRAAINAATDAPTDGAIPPQELSVSAISLNPDNPRTELGDLTDLGNSLRDHGQKTAISVMSRFAYLEGNPGREQNLESGARYVVIDGNSRLAAAREAGLETIKVMVDDNLGGNADEILESSLVANIHRKDLDHLDEARALQQLLKIHGTQEALAARLHRSQPWVSSRLALLKLTPQLQQRLEEGQESADLLRKVGSKKQEEQEAHLAKLKQQRAEETEARRKSTEERKARKVSSADEMKEYVAQAAPATLADSDQPLPAKHTVPEPRPNTTPEHDRSDPVDQAGAAAQANTPTSPSGLPFMPWKDGAAVTDIALLAMDDHQQSRMLHRYFRVVDPGTVAAAIRESCQPAEREALAAAMAKVADLICQE